MVLLIDNYDSFTFNVVQYLRQAGAEVVVRRNDELSLAEVRGLGATHIVLSPGPGTPDDSSVCLEVARAALEGSLKAPLLGVCLGHQVIAQVAGAEVRLAKDVRHGKTSPVSHDGMGIFAGLPSPVTVVRYHSLAVDEAPDSFVVSARSDDDGEIMGLRHVALPIESVQFHPESILSEGGLQMLNQFLKFQ